MHRYTPRWPLALSFRVLVATGLLVSATLAFADEPAADKPFLGASSTATERGAEITAIVPDSPAAKAGLVVGDIVRSVDGFLVGRKGPVVYSLNSDIRRSGGTVKLTVRQLSTARMVDITVDVGGPAQPQPPPPVQRRGRLGVLVSTSAQGETVTQLFPDTPAAAAGLKLGDVVTSIDGFKVGTTGGNVFSLPSEIRRSQGNVELTLLRAGQELKLQVDLGMPAKGLATRAHVLLIGLTNDRSVGKACSVSLQMMKARVQDAFRGNRKQRLDLKLLQGDEVTASNILRLVDRTTIAPTDTLFCYYVGHGAYDPRFAADDPSFGHLLQIPGEDLLRRSLRDHLIEKAARLTVLITDTCNVRADTRRELMPRAAPPSDAEPRLFTCLMRNAGVVDISGTGRDQYGWGGDGGTLFTLCLDDYLDMNFPATWPELVQDISEITDSAYRQMRKKILADPQGNNRDLIENIRQQEHQKPEGFIVSAQAVADGAAGDQAPASPAPAR